MNSCIICRAGASPCLLVTLGLIIIFGLMNVINMSHGEFFLLGACTVVVVQDAGGGLWLALGVLFVVSVVVLPRGLVGWFLQLPLPRRMTRGSD